MCFHCSSKRELVEKNSENFIDGDSSELYVDEVTLKLTRIISINASQSIVKIPISSHFYWLNLHFGCGNFPCFQLKSPWLLVKCPISCASRAHIGLLIDLPRIVRSPAPLRWPKKYYV